MNTTFLRHCVAVSVVMLILISLPATVGANAHSGFDAISDVLWYAAGSDSDYLWLFAADGSHSEPVSVNIDGTYEPLIGDFDGSGTSDVLWYAAGNDSDYLWLFAADGSHSEPVSVNIDGTYEPLVGNFGGEPFLGFLPTIRKSGT
jgi:hypothetical protein